MKKILAAILALAMLLSLAACSNPFISKTDSGDMLYSFASCLFYQRDGKYIEEEDFLKEIPPVGDLDVQAIYDSIEYNERMLYGHYELYNGKSDLKNYAKSAKFMEIVNTNSFDPDFTSTVSTLPVKIYAGPSDVHAARFVREHDFAELYFANEEGTGSIRVSCVYTVSGNTVTFTILDHLESLTDEEYRYIGYDYTIGTQKLVYTFSFEGPNLTLSNGDGSITLTGYSFCKGINPNIGGYLAPDSPAADGIDHFSGSISDDYVSSSVWLGEKECAVRSAIRMYDNGLVDFYWVTRDENYVETEHQRQFVYIGTYPMVLTDGKNVFYYTEGYTSRGMLEMQDNLSSQDLAEFEKMGEAEQQEIVEKKANLLKDLSDAFQEAGLNVTVDQTTGEIALDSAVLFGVDQSVISEEGKVFLREFLDVYTGVVFGDEYTDFVSKIMVEGHTDTSGAYDYNLALSQARADSVMAFCLSEESGVNASHLEALASTLEAVGYSFDKPIYNENGEVDMDASRRVSFRFIINIGD